MTSKKIFRFNEREYPQSQQQYKMGLSGKITMDSNKMVANNYGRFSVAKFIS